MTRKYTLPVLTALAAAAALAGCGSAATPPSHASLVIRHQTRGCHTWSVNGERFAATQTVGLRRGGWIMVTNNDVMPHKLVKTSGPAAQMLRPLMNDMGAKTRVVFGRRAPGLTRRYYAPTRLRTFGLGGPGQNRVRLDDEDRYGWS